MGCGVPGKGKIKTSITHATFSHEPSIMNESFTLKQIRINETFQDIKTNIVSHA